LESTFHWLSEDIVRFKIKVGVCKIFSKMQDLFQVQIVTHSAIATRHPGCRVIKSPVGKSPWGELRDEISPPAVILRLYNIRRGENMFLPPLNFSVDSVDDNLQVQSGVTISTDGDFSEKETLFVTPAVRRSQIVCWLTEMYLTRA